MKNNWYLKIATAKGAFLFPYDGYRTKREAEEQADLARKDPQTLVVEVINGKKHK